MKMSFSSVAIMTMAFSTAHAASWEGEYSGDCGDKAYVCHLLLNEARKGKVTLDLTVAPQANDADIKCHLQGTLNAAGTTLTGKLSRTDRAVEISETTSGVLIRGKDGVVSACDIKLDGELSIMGE